MEVRIWPLESAKLIEKETRLLTHVGVKDKIIIKWKRKRKWACKSGRVWAAQQLSLENPT